MLFLSSHAQLGGGEAYMRAILEGLGPSWNAGIVVLHDGPFVERLREAGHTVDVVASGGRWSIVGDALRLRPILRRMDPDVVHANGVKAALVAAIADPTRRARLLWLKFDFGWDGWLAHVVALRSDMVVGISSAVLATLRGRAARRGRVVLAGIEDYEVDPGRATKLLAAEFGGTSPDGPVVVLSGRLCPGKGQTDLISAAPTILARHPSARLLLLGVEDSFYPGYRATLEEHAERLGVRDAVTFSRLEGHRPADAVATVSGCSVLVQPSVEQERGGWKEGFGLAVVEAMHVGTPVAVYASGALPEVVADCGLVVPEGDHEALGHAVNRLLDDTTLREQLTAAAARRTRERFLMTRVVTEMATCYQELATLRRRQVD